MYQIENPMDKAMQGMNKAAGTYGSMMKKDIPANRDPGPNAFGALKAGVQGVRAGKEIVSFLAPAAEASGFLGGAEFMVPAAGAVEGAATAATAATAAPGIMAALGGPIGIGVGLASLGAYLFS